MPNDASNAFHEVLNEAEAWIENEKDILVAALKAEWTVIEPQIVDLGKTVLSQVWEAAKVYVASGFTSGGAAAAIASITAQLPSDLLALEHIVAAAFSGAVVSIQAKQVPA